MDVIRLVCPECDAVHRVKNITLGKLYRCKKCKAGLITMQPAVLVCPACGATRPPAHVEVSRLVTCDECEESPVMQVRIAGVTLGGGVFAEDDASATLDGAEAAPAAVTAAPIADDAPPPSAANETNAANAQKINDGRGDEADNAAAPEPRPGAHTESAPENFPAPSPDAAREAPPAASDAAPADANDVPGREPALAPPPRPAPSRATGMDTAVIHRMLADAAEDAAPGDDLGGERFYDDGATGALGAPGAEPAVAAVANSAAGGAPQAAPQWAGEGETAQGLRDVTDEVRGLRRALASQRASVFSRPVFGWLCLGALAALYGWLLSAFSMREDGAQRARAEAAALRRDIDALQQDKRALQKDKAALERDKEALLRDKEALQRENANLGRDLRVYYDRLNAKTRELDMLNKAYKEQCGR